MLVLEVNDQLEKLHSHVQGLGGSAGHRAPSEEVGTDSEAPEDRTEACRWLLLPSLAVRLLVAGRNPDSKEDLGRTAERGCPTRRWGVE